MDYSSGESISRKGGAIIKTVARAGFCCYDLLEGRNTWCGPCDAGFNFLSFDGDIRSKFKVISLGIDSFYDADTTLIVV